MMPSREPIASLHAGSYYYIEVRLAHLERAQRRARWLAAVAVALCGVTAIAELTAHARGAGAAAPVSRFQVVDSIQARALIVVDSAGRERARVGAPLPEPIVLGKRITRGSGVSGFLISDAEGNERGGYVTSDNYPNAFFTLDDMATQDVLFLTEPQGATALWLWHGSNAVRSSVGDAGPSFRIERDGKVVFKQPADTTR